MIAEILLAAAVALAPQPALLGVWAVSARRLRLICSCECMTCALGQHCGACCTGTHHIDEEER